MAKKKRHLFLVRFKVKGKPKTFRTTARSGDEAAKKIKSNGYIVSVTKVHK